MLANKDFIIKIISALVFFFITVKVLGPVLFQAIRKKMPGYHEPENDIDAMIRRQKERLRAQYGLTGKTQHDGLPAPDDSPSSPNFVSTPASPVVEKIMKEMKWGGSEFVKNIQATIAKNYSYTVAESKISAFILLAEKKKLIRYLSPDNQNNLESLKNFLSMTMILKILIDEIREKDYALIPKLAKKCNLTAEQFALALQMKLLMSVPKKNISEDKIYSDSPVLHQFSEETMTSALENMLTKEANLWAKGHSLFIEELALHISYANLLAPLPKLAHKKDKETAMQILAVDDEMSLEEIKRVYKKTAQSRHPDKITALKLPKLVEQKAIRNFGIIQQAYEILTAAKK